MHTMNTYSRRTSWSENMSTRGEELPNASIKLEDGTLARKGCLFSFKDYEGEEDNSLYLAAMTDMGYLKFLTEVAFGLDIKSQFHGKTHAELYLGKYDTNHGEEASSQRILLSIPPPLLSLLCLSKAGRAVQLGGRQRRFSCSGVRPDKREPNRAQPLPQNPRDHPRHRRRP